MIFFSCISPRIVLIIVLTLFLNKNDKKIESFSWNFIIKIWAIPNNFKLFNTNNLFKIKVKI